MKDLFFYYRKKTTSNRELIETISEKFPHAKFKLISGSIFQFISQVAKESKTDFFWVFELDTIGWDTLISYNVETWDKEYLHIFESKSTKAYLVPRDVKFDKTANDFLDKKVIKTDAIKPTPFNVFFISYDENNASKNLRYVKEKRSDVKVISDIKGIFNAHLEAAKQSNTDFFWVVDADATVIDAFDFHYTVPEWDFDVVHIWKSVNPINHLEYGHGGVKLIPKHLILTADEDTAVDITTSIGANIKVMDEISNINNFATSPFNAWRGAFRECVKLASGVIDRQVQTETDERLSAWTSKGGSRPLGEYVKGGASAGEWYGKTYKGDKNALAMINDYNWLKEQFEAHIKLFPPEMFLDQEETKSEVNGNTEAITEAQALATS
jgi:hypothetical protein